MKGNNLTLVTGLFDIGRGDMLNNFKRPFDHYLECFSKLLKIDYPMVIYIQPEYESFIWEHRNPENTKIITKTLDDLRKFPFYDKIQEIRNNPSWYNQAGWLKDSTQAQLELYNPLVMSKMFFLNDASLFNFFDTKNYMWVDAGLANTVNLDQYFTKEFEKRVKSHLNKMMFVAFPYDGQDEVHGFTKDAMNRYAGEDTTYVCRGGIFGGNKDAINAANDAYYHLLNDTLNSGYMGTEESIFTLMTYREKSKYNVRFIENNGLVYKFFEDLFNDKYNPEPEFPLALYSLTYNTSSQFKMWIDSFIAAYPEEFKKYKKYVIDNTTDKKEKVKYNKLFKEYGFEVIHEGTNIGIQDGRQLAAEHFDKSDHKYYVFFEEDMNLVSKDDKTQTKKGFVRYVPNLFETSMEIMEQYDFDYLRYTIIGFYGDADNDWAYKNVPPDKKALYYPETKIKNTEELRWKTVIHWVGTYHNIAFAAGFFHVDNWPCIWSKRGNYQAYLADPYEYKYEQTVMSQCRTYMEEGKLAGGCILGAPIEHNRVKFYDGKTRRENKHYTN